MVESPFEFPKSPKDELYGHDRNRHRSCSRSRTSQKSISVAKLYEEVDLVKVQNTVQVIVVGNQEEVAHPKEEEEALLKE